MLRVNTAVTRRTASRTVRRGEQLELNYATLVNCDPARDMVLAEVDGELVAYGRVLWNDLIDGGRNYENLGFVHPAWRRRGIGGALHRPTSPAAGDRRRAPGRRARVAAVRG